MRIRHGLNRVVRAPAFGVVVLTPVVLAGAVAAAPGGVGTAVPNDDMTAMAVAEPAPTEGASVVAMTKRPSDFRFAATALGPPPPAAVISSPGGMRIPAMALTAYRKAEQTMAATTPGCGVSWNLLAGIGRIESSHANGGATDARGTAVRPIYGPVLDGSLPGNEIIVQSNVGGRAVYARAMGPMQFLPGTWSRYASDGDGDGKADPQNIFDASLGAARYLCSGGLNLRNQAQVLTAILRYNNSMAYAENVMGWAAAYATGVAPIDLPPISGPVPVLSDGHLEMPDSLTPDLTGLHTGDALTQLMGNSTAAGQLLPGPMPGPAEGVVPEHGCQVICMASQLAPSETAPTPELPPWMQPMTPLPWMTPQEPPAWLAPQGPLPGMAPAPAAGPMTGSGPLPGPGAPAPEPAAAVAPPAAAPLPGMPPAPGPLPGMPPAAAPLPGMPPAAAEAPAVPGPQTPPWMAPGPAPAAPAEAAPVHGALPGPAA